MHWGKNRLNSNSLNRTRICQSISELYLSTIPYELFLTLNIKHLSCLGQTLSAQQLTQCLPLFFRCTRVKLLYIDINGTAWILVSCELENIHGYIVQTRYTTQPECCWDLYLEMCILTLFSTLCSFVIAWFLLAFNVTDAFIDPGTFIEKSDRAIA